MRLWFEIAFVLALIVANGLFSMSETAVVSSRKARLQGRAEAGDAAAGEALKLAEAPNVFLATVQVGITLIGILSGAFGGAALTGALAESLRSLPGVGAYAEGIAFAVVVLAITYLSLVVGELVPKRVALNAPEAIAARVAGPMGRLSTVASPAVRLLGVSTEAALRLLRIRASNEPPITAEEVGVLLEQGARAGVFHPAEQEMVEGVFALADQRANALMTPRPDVVWLDLDDSPEQQRATITRAPHSRFPVGRGSLDHAHGIIRAKDLLTAGDQPNGAGLDRHVRSALILPETTSALGVLEHFRRSGEQLALLVDEYGGTAGVITLQDLLEAIVGDLPDAGEVANPEAVQRDDGSWLLGGGFGARDVRDLLDIRDLPGEAEGDYETLGGFMLAQLGRIPAAGDGFTFGDWHFEVVDMDGHRIDKVLASRRATSS